MLCRAIEVSVVLSVQAAFLQQGGKQDYPGDDRLSGISAEDTVLPAVSPQQDGMKEAFLEIGQGADLRIGEGLPYGRDYELIVVVIRTVDNGNTDPSELRHRHLHAEHVGIQRLPIAIGEDDPRQVAVIDRIHKAVLGMARSQRAINCDRNDLAEITRRAQISTPRKSRASQPMPKLSVATPRLMLAISRKRRLKDSPLATAR